MGCEQSKIKEEPEAQKPDVEESGRRGRTQSPQQPSWMYDDDDDDTGSDCSAPQLFRITPTNRAATDKGSWDWWMQEIRQEKLTKDGYCRARLQDIQNRLINQHSEDSTNVEMDISSCFMERTAPYTLGRLFASPHVKEIRFITSLRLDGNYFTDHGFGSMLATMSVANERKPILPVLRQLFLNNMNIDRVSAAGICAYLFPINYKMESTQTQLGPLPVIAPQYNPISRTHPRVPLFPSLEMLSMSDNSGLGTAGLATILRVLLASHFETHNLSALDLSRCGIDDTAERVLKEYFDQLHFCIEDGGHPVYTRSLLLLGNKHGISNIRQINAPVEMRVVL